MNRTDTYPRVITSLLLGMLSTMATAAGFDAKLDWTDLRYVSIPVDGLVTAVDVAPGQRVDKGGSLVRLSQSAPRFNLRKAQSAVNATTPELKEALREKSDAETLYEQTVLSDIELQTAVIRYEQVKAKHEAALAELDRAKWAMGWTRVTAPVDVVVISSSVFPGQMVAGDVRSEPLMVLAAADAMAAVATVSADKLGEVAVGDAMRIEVGADGYPARITAIEWLSQKNAVDRVRLHVRFDTGKRFLPGQKASIRLP